MFSLAKILVPVDFSERSRAAARYAKVLAVRAGSELTLLHVVAPPYGVAVPEVGGAVFVVERLAEAQDQMDAFLNSELSALPVNRIVVQGDPAHKIVEFAHSQQDSLILMPTHGYGPLRRFILGSVTAKVLHDSDCPVWTGVHLGEVPADEKIPFSRIVCAVDLSPHSVKTLCWAHRMAGAFGARLTLVNVVPDLQPFEAGLRDQDFHTYLAGVANKELEKLQNDLGTHADAFIGKGDPAKAIRAIAEQLGAELLVIGRSSGAGILGRLRTNAYAIIRQAPCPVVSV